MFRTNIEVNYLKWKNSKIVALEIEKYNFIFYTPSV